MLGLSCAASADMVTFTHSGHGTGKIGAVDFIASFTITAIGDTGDRIAPFPDVFAIPHLSATIDIDGVGVFDFMEGTRTFVNSDVQAVGFSRIGGSDLFDGPFGVAVFSTWDMLSSIGPISGGGQLLQWADGVNTSGGVLDFDDAELTGGVTFTAVVVPAPSAAALLAFGGIAATRRRR